MTRLEALRILGLSEGATADSIRSAYRKRALETHPDRGGTAAEFLKVQAAYEVLCAAAEWGDSRASDFDSTLDARLGDIRNAFDLLNQEASAFCDQSFQEFDAALVSAINGYQSHDELKQRAQRDITFIWSQNVARIASFVEERVGSIADQHDKWLQEYLRPVVDAARAQNPPRWLETVPCGAALIILGLVSASASIHFQNIWLAMPAGLSLPSGVIFPLRYHRRFAVKRIIKGVRLADMAKKTGLGPLAVETRWVSEEHAAGVGSFMVGGIGAIFLGPIGGIVGGAVGSLLGWLIGESLTTRKRKLYESVVENVNQRIPQMMAEFNQRLGSTEEAMLRAVKENFARNVRTVVGLLKS